MHSWVDGQPSVAVNLQNRGLAYGDGLFETIAVRGGQPSLLDGHLARLALGCQRLAISADMALVRDELLRYACQLGEGVAKLILTRGDSQRGYAPVAGAVPRRILQGSPLPSYPVEHAEGLMRDGQGRVIEGVYSNLFLVRDGVLFTADLSRCGVAGVMRAALLEQAVLLGIPAQVADLPFDALEQADEVFVCNSVYGIWPVRGVAALNWSPGPLTRKLQAVARTLLET